MKDLSWEILLGEALGVKTLLMEALIWEFSYLEAFINFFFEEVTSMISSCLSCKDFQV